MKNVVLIGDSIRLGYQGYVQELLGPNVKVFGPAENCRYSKFVLWGMFSWMGEFGYPKVDALHFNAGIWDLHRCTADGEIFTEIGEYAELTDGEQNRLFAMQEEINFLIENLK